MTMTPVEALEEIKRRHRELLRGDCKVLSRGDNCTCTLCLCDNVRDALDKELNRGEALLEAMAVLYECELTDIAEVRQKAHDAIIKYKAAKRGGKGGR